MATPTCSICDHPQRPQIEAALHAGTPRRQIGVQFGVGTSTLGRHLQHVPGLQAAPQIPQPDAPAADPTRPTVAQCAALLEQLTTRLAAGQGELETAAQALPQAQQAVRLARWKEDPVRRHQAAETLQRAQQQVEEFTASITVLGEARQQAAWELAQAQARRQQQEQQHWLTVVLPQLEDPFDIYCCRLMARLSRVPPTTPAATLQRLGPMGASQLRVATCQRLRQQYPFHEEDPVHA
jgi:hypothetical protein